MAQTSTAAPPTEKSPAETILAGGTFADIAGLDENGLNAIYELAYNEFEQGDFAAAERTFRVLCFSDHRAERHWLGLGAARQRLKDYEGAIQAYSMAAETGSTNPLVPLRAAECYVSLGLLEEAVSGLETAIQWAGNADDPAAIGRHIDVLFEVVKKLAGGSADAQGAGS